MAEIFCLESLRKRNAADRGFREWKRIFRSFTEFDEKTRWADLPDEIILFASDSGAKGKHALYDLIMGANQLGCGDDFETRDFDRLSLLMNGYFFITDQARFECMRQLGWLETIPKADRSIIELVMDSESYDYKAQLETPDPTPLHPCYEENRLSRGLDKPALVRKYAPEALKQFEERVGSRNSHPARSTFRQSVEKSLLRLAGTRSFRKRQEKWK
ncbi:MAG: hypothetical protein ACP5SH_22200 [Syntrophobacteraceae bacterium]